MTTNKKISFIQVIKGLLSFLIQHKKQNTFEAKEQQRKNKGEEMR
jgi:hypothetical protein